LRELAAHVLSMKVLGCYPARRPKDYLSNNPA
jgi:hypothetical protein